MKILFLTFYYPPDLSAGSFRAAAFISAFRRNFGDAVEVEVLTTSPNRYDGMQLDETAVDQPGVRITRIPVRAHKSGIRDQARSFCQFAAGAMKHAARAKPDLIHATSSRLFTAATAAFIARRTGKPLYLDIRDIFTETIGDVFPASTTRFALPLINQIEKFTLRSADHINVVSPAFVEYLAPRAGHGNFSVFTNGIDAEFLQPAQLPEMRRARPLVVIAGNMGEGQGLHHIIPALAAARPHVDFRLIGGGGRRAALEEALKDARVGNVELVSPLPRKAIPGEYARADVLMLHLNDVPAFKRVIPSKIFEYAAAGLPIVAGVAGHARDFAEQEIAGSYVFPPCDVTEGLAALDRALEGPARFDRSAFVASYRRDAIMDRIAAEVVELGRSRTNAVATALTNESHQQDLPV